MGTTINLNEWNITTSKFREWVIYNKLDVFEIATTGGNGGHYYFFENDEDVTAFNLQFSRDVSRILFYGPYIPLLSI